MLMSGSQATGLAQKQAGLGANFPFGVQGCMTLDKSPSLN